MIKLLVLKLCHIHLFWNFASKQDMLWLGYVTQHFSFKIVLNTAKMPFICCAIIIRCLQSKDFRGQIYNTRHLFIIMLFIRRRDSFIQQITYQNLIIRLQCIFACYSKLFVLMTSTVERMLRSSCTILLLTNHRW